MDNIENTEPVGVEDVTPSTDNSATDTQPAEPVNEASETAEEGIASNPWDNDPKFKGKSPEDIYKAYKESEKLSGQLSQKARVANLIEERFGVTPDQFTAQLEAQEQQRRQELYANNPLAPLMDEVSELKAYKQQQEAEKALAEVNRQLDSFVKANPAYETHRDKILKLALTPGIGYDPQTGMESSIEDLANEWVGSVRAQGQQDAAHKIETKVMNKPTGASKSEQKQKVGYEALKELPLSERLRTFENLMQ